MSTPSASSGDDTDMDQEMWDEEADLELTRLVVEEAEAAAALTMPTVELDLELFYDDEDALCAKLHPCSVTGDVHPPPERGASSSPRLEAPPSSPVQKGPPPHACPTEPRTSSSTSKFPPWSPPKLPAARRALDLLEVGRRSVTNLDTGEVLTVDDVAHMYQETSVQQRGAFDIAREQSPQCRRASSSSRSRTRTPGEFKEAVLAAVDSAPPTPSRLSSGQTRSRAASERADLFLSQYSPGGHLTSPPKRRLVGSAEDDGGSRFSMHSPTRSPRSSPAPSSSSFSPISSPVPASLDSPRSMTSSPEPFTPIWSSVRDARPSAVEVAQWRASHFGKLGGVGVGGAPAVLRAQFLWLQRSVTRSSLQEAMDATIADDVEPLLVRGELRVATTASAARAWHALRGRPCRLVLDDDGQRDTKAAAAAGSLSARAASFGSDRGGSPNSPRAMSFGGRGGRGASRRTFGLGSPRGSSGPLSPRGNRGDATADATTGSSAEARPVALPVESDRLPTRDEAEKALLAAERKALDGVKLLCGDGGVCFRLEHMLAVGETSQGGCDFWALVQTEASAEPQRLRFRCGKPAERRRWLHALTELARRRVLTQHVQGGLRWSSTLEQLEAEGAIAGRSPSSTDETPSTPSSGA